MTTKKTTAKRQISMLVPEDLLNQVDTKLFRLRMKTGNPHKRSRLITGLLKDWLSEPNRLSEKYQIIDKHILGKENK